MHKVCLHCGAHLSKNAKFCDRCGTALPPQVTMSATASAQCNKCGAAIKSNARFCSVCGSIIDLNLFADKPTTQDYSNTKDIDSAEGPEYGAGRSASATESSKNKTVTSIHQHGKLTKHKPQGTKHRLLPIHLSGHMKKRNMYLLLPLFSCPSLSAFVC